jgi:hypothetical protein
MWIQGTISWAELFIGHLTKPFRLITERHSWEVRADFGRREKLFGQTCQYIYLMRGQLQLVANISINRGDGSPLHMIP